jgi:hypothetical protein
VQSKAFVARKGKKERETKLKSKELGEESLEKVQLQTPNPSPKP